ncbi:MAG: porin [Desulfobacterales bacterium]|nr:porin [Desulfobacterales bacterium]
MENVSVKKNSRRLTLALVCWVLSLATLSSPVLAADDARIAELQRQIEAQQAMLEELSKQVKELRQAAANQAVGVDQGPKPANDTQLEVFGKPIVTSTDPRFKVKISGQVNRQVAYAEDGNNSKFYHTDSDNSPTRINIEAQGKLSDDLTVGARVEAGYQDNRPLNVNQNNENSGFDFTSRWLETHIDSQRFGKLSIGKGFASSFFINETDLSGTQVVSLLSPGNLFGGLLFYSNDINNYTNIRVSDVFVDLENLSIVNRVRYDSPHFYGFQLSGSTGSNQRHDATLRYKNDIGDFRFSGASAYQRNSFGGLLDWRVDGALSTLHKPSGLSLTGGAFYARANSDNRHLQGFIVKGGWRKNFFDFGETALSIDYVQNDDASADDEDGKTYSAFVVQDIDRWGMQVYGGYRYYDLDRQRLDTESIHVPVIGTRKVF